MNRSENIAELAAALAKAQGEMPKIYREKVAKIQTRKGGTYTYRYADLEDILSRVRPILSRHGLAVVHDCVVTSEEVTGAEKWLRWHASVTATLFHSSGQWLSCSPMLGCSDMPGNSGQVVQSLSTTLRRYTTQAILGISTEDDLDSQDTGHAGTDEHDEMDELIAQCRQSIATAQTLERLDEIGKSLANMPQVVKDECRQLYSVRRGQLQRRVESEEKEGGEA